MNEAETRAEHIDPSLKAAGWGVVEGSTAGKEGSESVTKCNRLKLPAALKKSLLHPAFSGEL